MVSEKNSQAIVALIIGDKNYNDNFITLRVWETMASDAVMLIDEEFDTKHRIINDARFYVNNRAELIDRVNELKRSDALRKEMLSIQHDILNKTRAKKAEWQDAFKKAIDL
ncbi:beta-glucosyl-HMC-alpha-glucosyltransferase [Escherichia phage 236Ecol005PP]